MVCVVCVDLILQLERELARKQQKIIEMNENLTLFRGFFENAPIMMGRIFLAFFSVRKMEGERERERGQKSKRKDELRVHSMTPANFFLIFFLIFFPLRTGSVEVIDRDTDIRFLVVNEATAKAFGVSREFLLNERYSTLGMVYREERKRREGLERKIEEQMEEGGEEARSAITLLTTDPRVSCPTCFLGVTAEARLKMNEWIRLYRYIDQHSFFLVWLRQLR